MKLDRTYQIEKPPEPPIDWKTYENLISKEWNDLLKQGSQTTEKDIQSFLEQYPSMVPGAFNLRGNESGHYPWLCGLISQPILPSYDYHRPDFMWLALNSSTVEPVLIEIEDPNKRWWTDSGQATAQLTQALDQIAEWKAWFGEPQNVLAFKDVYGLSRVEWMKREFNPSYLLIYGRRSEANKKPNLTAKRNQLAPNDVTIMTYDRLHPNPKAHQLVCMKIKNDNGAYVFNTVSVPATLTLGPSLASEHAQLLDFDKSIDSNKHISRERKEFLIQRLAYWNEWSKTSDRGVVCSGDKE